MILKHQPARRSAEVQVIPQTDEGHSECRKFGQGVDQMLQGSPKAIDLPDYDCVMSSVGALGEAGKYFGDFLRDPPSKLAVLSRS
jgi:hypothetical protein